MEAFKIIGLKILNHSFIDDITSPGLEFVSDGEDFNGPYSTVMIGPNGTGKSQLLRIISDIFEDLKASAGKPDYKFRIRYQYQLILMKGKKFFRVTYRRRIHLSKEEKKVANLKTLMVELLKGRNLEAESTIENDGSFLPEMVIVNSFLVNDKFRFARRSAENEFYNYLGVRDSSSTARTRAYIRSVINMIVKDIGSEEKLANLKKVLRYIGYDPTFLGVNYRLRYREHFFSGKLTLEEMKRLLEDPSTYSGREGTSYSEGFFMQIREDNARLKGIQTAINLIAAQTAGQKTNKINLNLLSTEEDLPNFQVLDDMLKLDLIESPSLTFSKTSRNASGREVNVDKFSSGEFNLFASYIGLRALARPGSLILIDEPEISLHPNWQLKYIHFLREIFENMPSVHFVIATHSHFLISDLKPDISEIIKLGRTENGLQYYSIKGDTYGQSAENILYNIFGMRSARNFYFEVEIRELLQLISNSELTADKQQLKADVSRRIQKLSGYTIDRNDPLNRILAQAREFVQTS